MSQHQMSHAYPPSYQNLSPKPPYVNTASSSPATGHPGAYTSPSGTPGPTYPYPIRHRSTSDSSEDPVLPMGQSERSKEEKAGEGEYPPGWTAEDAAAEKEFLEKDMFNWTDMKDWRFWIRKEWWYWYLGGAILIVLVALMALYHDDIVEWLTPVANWMKDLPAGWVIPIAVIFILSFPPLFGQEIVAVLCGVVWGLWVGFGIVAAGTFLGEVGNFYAFKYCFRSRAEKYERDNLNYGIMAHVVREGGFFFIFTVRLSAIPGHFTTAVFATCGMGIFIFSLACILTLPKQLIVVYLGVLFKEKEKSQKSRIISWVVLVAGLIITIWAVWYCYREMNKVKLIVWRKQRMAMAAKGISIDPITGKRRQTYRDAAIHVPARDEEEALSPILQEHAQHPDAHYEADLHTHPHGGVEREGEIAFDYDRHRVEHFPQARPAYPVHADIDRNPSIKTVYNDRDQAPIPTSFPIAEPAGGQRMDFSRPYGQDGGRAQSPIPGRQGYQS